MPASVQATVEAPWGTSEERTPREVVYPREVYSYTRVLGDPTPRGSARDETTIPGVPEFIVVPRVSFPPGLPRATGLPPRVEKSPAKSAPVRFAVAGRLAVAAKTPCINPAPSLPRPRRRRPLRSYRAARRHVGSVGDTTPAPTPPTPTHPSRIAAPPLARDPLPPRLSLPRHVLEGAPGSDEALWRPASPGAVLMPSPSEAVPGARRTPNGAHRPAIHRLAASRSNSVVCTTSRGSVAATARRAAARRSRTPRRGARASPRRVERAGRLAEARRAEHQLPAAAGGGWRRRVHAQIVVVLQPDVPSPDVRERDARAVAGEKRAVDTRRGRGSARA